MLHLLSPRHQTKTTLASELLLTCKWLNEDYNSFNKIVSHYKIFFLLRYIETMMQHFGWVLENHAMVQTPILKLLNSLSFHSYFRLGLTLLDKQIVTFGTNPVFYHQKKLHHSLSVLIHHLRTG